MLKGLPANFLSVNVFSIFRFLGRVYQAVSFGMARGVNVDFFLQSSNVMSTNILNI